MRTNKSFWFHRAITLCLLLVISVSSSMVVLARSDKSLAGELLVSGRAENGERAYVLLNGEPAYSGRTFFSAGIITTAENAAIIKLGKLGYLELAPNSTLDLSFSENSITGKLSAGNVKVFNGEGVSVNIENAESFPAPPQQQTGSSFNRRVWVPILVLAGIVAIAAAVTLSGDDEVVSPIR